MASSNSLEEHFAIFRENIIGNDQSFRSPYGEKKILYADWTATGRAYAPVENYIQQQILPFIANTHSHSTITATTTANEYEDARVTIKQHVNANGDDALVFCGSGMTGAVNKLQRLLGMRIPERLGDYLKKGTPAVEVDDELRPVVFITQMEHHSNHTSWLETIATVVIINNKDGNTDLDHFRYLMHQYQNRPNKIAAVTACSNVTGIQTPYHEIAGIIHQHGGRCFVDFACSAPYVTIDMHPSEPGHHLDAIYFSPHKFLGGPGAAGVLIFNRGLYNNRVPDQPGGGTVIYSNPWGGHNYTNSIEEREDGGTPPILQGIKAGLCTGLKDKMGVENIRMREQELLNIIFDEFKKIPNACVLEGGVTNRLGIVSFTISGAHHNLVVKLLNDRFGIQVRGGCSCAGTYGHYLLQVKKTQSSRVLARILAGDLKSKPGWVRLSVHPVMTDKEAHRIMQAIKLTAANYREWAAAYTYNPANNEFYHISALQGLCCV